MKFKLAVDVCVGLFHDILINEFMEYDNDKRPITRNGDGYVHLFDFSFTIKKDGEMVLDRSENVRLPEGRASGHADLFIYFGFNRFS